MSNEALASHRKRAKALVHYIVFESDLKNFRGPNQIRLPIAQMVRSICAQRSIAKFSFENGEAIDLLTVEQCEILDEACRKTYTDLWLNFNEKSAA